MKVSSRQEKQWLRVQTNYSPLISADSTFPEKSINVICFPRMAPQQKRL